MFLFKKNVYKYKYGQDSWISFFLFVYVHKAGLFYLIFFGIKMWPLYKFRRSKSWGLPVLS